MAGIKLEDAKFATRLIVHYMCKVPDNLFKSSIEKTAFILESREGKQLLKGKAKY